MREVTCRDVRHVDVERAMKPLNALVSPLLAIPASIMVFGVSMSWWKNSPSLAKVYDESPVVSFQNRIVDFCAVLGLA